MSGPSEALTPPDARASRRHYWLPLALAAVVVSLDQLTKLWVVQALGLYESITVWEGFFALTYVRNEGAAFSLLTGARWLLVALAFVALGLLYVFRAHLGVERASGRLALGLIVGGIIGNLIDRLFLGYVIDFLDFIIPLVDYRWPTFNVADCGIVCGVAIYLIQGLGPREDPSTGATAPKEDGASPPAAKG